MNHGFGLVIKGSSRLNKKSYDLTIFNILYWLLNSMAILTLFLQMPVAKVINFFKQSILGPRFRFSAVSYVYVSVIKNGANIRKESIIGALVLKGPCLFGIRELTSASYESRTSSGPDCLQTKLNSDAQMTDEFPGNILMGQICLGEDIASQSWEEIITGDRIKGFLFPIVCSVFILFFSLKVRGCVRSQCLSMTTLRFGTTLTSRLWAS